MSVFWGDEVQQVCPILQTSLTMIMKMRVDKCHPGRGKRVKIPLLPNSVGKKSANDAGLKQGHDNNLDPRSLKRPEHKATSLPRSHPTRT